jgi:hypothetical protein
LSKNVHIFIFEKHE